MTKYTNPFYTIGEAITLLRSLGASPQCNIPEGQFDWREDILSVMVTRTYEGSSHYFNLEIHIDRQGFYELHQMLGGTATISEHSDLYDKVSLKLGAHLEVFMLSPKGEDLAL